PVGASLAVDGRFDDDGLEREELEEDSEKRSEGEAEGAPPEPSPSERAAQALGYRSFEEFWEAVFEAPLHRVESFRPALLAYAVLVRAHGDRALHRGRDAFMVKRIEQVVPSGVAPERVVAVVGAAHAAAFAARDVDLSLDSTLPASVPCAVTLIPYSFPRLAEQ